MKNTTTPVLWLLGTLAACIAIAGGQCGCAGYPPGAHVSADAGADAAPTPYTQCEALAMSPHINAAQWQYGIEAGCWGGGE